MGRVRYAWRVFSGASTFVPGLSRLGFSKIEDSDDAEYCYSVWLRHLAAASLVGVRDVPKDVAELGPGNSLGLGLAALISGAKRFSAFDVVSHVIDGSHLALFDQLVHLFQSRTPIPHGEGLEEVSPRLDDYSFPSALFSEPHLAESLSTDRLAAIRASLEKGTEEFVCYRVPWDNAKVLQAESVDLVISQAVMEYVEDLDDCYQRLCSWLRPGGWMSHQIDFSSHGITDRWDAHWTRPDLEWRVLRGKRPYFLTRNTRSKHLGSMRGAGFEVFNERQVKDTPRISREQLAPSFCEMSDEDLTVRDALLQARKL